MTPRQRTQRSREAAEHGAWTRRLVATWQRTTPAEREAGREWYVRAEREAARIATLAPDGIGRKRAAALIAALSPRTRWAENVEAAESAACAAARVTDAERDAFGPDTFEAAIWHATQAHGLSDPRHKACRILSGERPERVLGGPKVRAFFANITGDARAVTVDVWAYRAAIGRRAPGEFSERTYRRLERAYQAAADRLGVPPRELQAAIWIHTRGSAD